MPRMVWFNSKILPESEAKLSVYDSALLFGDSVFEMTRSFNKVHFKLREHLERLFRSMKCVHINSGYTIEELEQACYQVCEVNKNSFEQSDEYRLLINVSRGLLSIYEGIVGVEPGPNVIITCFPLKWTVAGMGKLYDEGINMVVTSQRAIPADLMDPKIKHRSRLYLQLANIEASKAKGKNNWALLLDTNGFVAEGTGDNIFIVKEGVVYTPEGRNILRGISREYVLWLADQLNLSRVDTEKNLTLYDLYDADEIFITGTPFCMLPVCRVNNLVVGDGRVGKITKYLLSEWSGKVGLDIVEQIKSWDKKIEGTTPYQFKN